MSRNWHYNWSKFYYYKKHYNYFFAIKKILPNFFRAIKVYLTNFFSYKNKNMKNNKILALFELKGILSSVMLKNSDFRIKLYKE